MHRDPENHLQHASTRYFRLDRRDLAYLTFILESYEGLATLSTVDKKETIVRITSLAGGAVHLDQVIAALQQEIELTEVAAPANGANGG